MSKRVRLLTTAGTIATLLIVAALALATAQPGQAQDDAQEPATQERTITVGGEGAVMAAPDQATIRLGVTNEAPTATEALETNRGLVQDVISATLALEIPEDQVQTQVLQLLPIREETPQPLPAEDGAEPATSTAQAAQQEITGYRARTIVAITVDDVDTIGTVIDEAVAAGANTIEGVRFDISDREAILEQARQQAMENARTAAETLVAAEGAELGQVITIRAFGGGPTSVVAFEEAAAVGGAGFPVQPGQQTVTINVEVTWALQ